MNRVIVKSNLGFALISVATLGIVVPQRVEWCCAPYSPATGKLDDVPDSYPQFPFPPPKASTFKVIPQNLLIKPNDKTNLDFVVSDKLIPALANAGYEYSFYRIRDSGIAIVTRLENINSDGTPKNKGERYISGNYCKGILDCLRSLFIARPGYYRVIVFIISPYTIIQSPQGISKLQADSIFTAGADRPYKSILSNEFSSSYECTALIYQFIKPNEEDPPKELSPSELTCQMHLEKAGIWSNLLKNRK